MAAASTTLTLELTLPLEQRIQEFKSDDERMRDVNEFVTDILERACVEAETRRLQSKKSKLDIIGFHNGTKRMGAWSNRARGFMSRVITAICNCTNQVRNAAANRT